MIASLPLTNRTFSNAQITQYWKDGFLFPIQVFDRDEAIEFRAELEQIEAEWLNNDLPLPLNTYKRMNSNCVMPVSHRIASDPRLLDLIEAVIGPDIMVYGVEYFIKEPNTRHIVTMHQDLTYWGLGATDGIVTAWVSLSPSTPASGCIEFIRGSHKNPILPHQDSNDDSNLLSRGQEIQVDIADDDKVPIEIHPGQISLHHGLTIHGSGPNTTADRRIACVIRYVSPNVAQEVGEKDYAMLVRGADRAGNFINYAPPSKPFSTDSLALFEEIRTTQAKFVMSGANDTKGLYS